MPAIKSPVHSSNRLLQTIAGNVRRLRIDRGLKQSELAESAGCTQGTISLIERAIQDPSASHLVGISRTLGVSVDDLISE